MDTKNHTLQVVSNTIGDGYFAFVPFHAGKSLHPKIVKEVSEAIG